jgi:RecB family exonuclease
MTTKTRTIELDEATATALEEQATERGLTIPDLLAEFAGEQRAPVAATPEEIAELDRRWATVRERSSTVPHSEAVRWLETWGTRVFKPWRAQ